MPGQIKAMISELIRQRVGGNPHLEASFKIKLIMKGVDPDMYDDHSVDDPAVIHRLRTIAEGLGHTLRA